VTAVLAAESLGKSYGHTQVLKAASFNAHAGRITAVMGRNGSGKSTMLDLAAGWRPPDFGAVHFAGQVWQRPRLHEMAELGLFYLPQQVPMSSSFRVQVFLDALARRFGDQEIAHAIDVMRLGDLLHEYPPTLSGGEKARVAVAMAMIRMPTCLLADEPFARVAPLDQELMANALREMADRGVAIAVTGHDVPVLFHAADEVIWVVAGTTRHLGTPAEAVQDHHFRRGYLGPGAWSAQQLGAAREGT